VDIFFVISGYLVINKIASKHRAGDFSILSFLDSRAQRLLPALYVSIIFIAVVSYFTLWDRQIVDVFYSLIGAIFYSSNIFFNQEIDYFTPDFVYMPSLHLWSLSLEEQFYLFTALLPALVSRKAYLIGLGLTSLTLYVIFFREQFAFYLLPFRVWEFYLGGYIATLELRRVPNHWLIILTFICLMILVFTPINIPSITLVVFVAFLVAPLLAYHSHFNIHERGSEFLSYLGRCSYSTYLFHQPLVVLSYSLFPLNFGVKWVFFFLAFAMGSLSYHFIENTFRHKYKFSLLTYSILGICLAVVLTAAVIATKGKTDNLVLTDQLVLTQNESCSFKVDSPNTCVLNFSNAGKKVLIIGDSHASALIPAFKNVFNKTEVHVDFISADGCMPFTGELRDDHKSVFCTSYDQYLEKILHKYDLLLMSARWSLYFHGSYGGRDAAKFSVSHQEVVENLDQQLSFNDLKTIIILQVPEQLVDSKILLNKKSPNNFSIGAKDHLQLKQNYMEYILKLRKQVDIIEFDDLFCDASICILFSEGFLYSDKDHLSPTGANYITDSLRVQLIELGVFDEL
jgi:peptidoglycan/LPS O-acetylase OafA/YrhL